jgi:hypothetical protein
MKLFRSRRGERPGDVFVLSWLLLEDEWIVERAMGQRRKEAQYEGVSLGDAQLALH